MKPWIVAALVLTLGGFTSQAHAGLKTLRRQADEGNPKAELKLGELYQYGVGRPDHLIHALVWYDRAAPHLKRAAVLAKRTAALLTPKERERAAAMAQPLLGPPAKSPSVVSTKIRPSAKLAALTPR